MKKIISIIAVVVALCAMTTSVFAAVSATGEVTGATLEGTTITYDPSNTEGFVYKLIYTSDSNLKNCTVKLNVEDLLNKGWTVSAVDGAYSYESSVSATGTTTIQIKFTAGEYEANGKAVAQFKAVPGAGATIEGATFTMTPVIANMNKEKVTAAVTYTLAEAAAQKTPAAVTGGTAEFKSFTGSTGTVYTNVWVNKYTAKANDETIKAVKLAFNGKTVTVSDVEIAAGGTAEFDVAIVGAALNATVTPSVEVK